jgi:regulatory protein
MARASQRGKQQADTPVDPARKAKSECLRLLAVKPRTRADLAKALARKGFEPDVIEPVLEKLERARLIDDADYAEMLVRSRHTYNGLGRRALKSELLRQGVDGAVADEAVGMIGAEDEEARSRQLVRKRLPGLAGADQQTAVRRLVGMLARKGYPEGLAYRVVRQELADAGRETALLDELPPG